ncbi:hypothetical protein [Paenibacillus methanolicus]|uniref:YolD-like protein n=1 Tax=Paenibacillus methanolicus TaxID=582686 RepID=A0A5S5CIT1_9BACL|nr:hypothetical protein [Paenibacillus methanolicus]TYP79434.1 hypothetical protein BCM02_101552 [Paenibacillus methanolicus]
MSNKIQFIEWTVEGNRKITVIDSNGKVFSGRAYTFNENVLHVDTKEGLLEIKIDKIKEIFSIKE